MKRPFHALAAAVVLTAGLALSAQAWEVQNASFEDADESSDNAYGDLAAFWGRWGHWMNRETGWKPVRTGKCLMGYHHWQIEEDETSGAYQDIDGVPSGQAYTFKIWAMKDKDSDVENIELRLELLGGVSTVASKNYKLSDLNGNDWTELSVNGTPETEGLRVLVVVTPKKGGDRHGALKFDDATLTADE
jgi:hypothetical protein